MSKKSQASEAKNERETRQGMSHRVSTSTDVKSLGPLKELVRGYGDQDGIPVAVNIFFQHRFHDGDAKEFYEQQARNKLNPKAVPLIF